MPQGWASSATAFHLRMKTWLSSLSEVVYVDDVLIDGRNEWEHNRNLRGVIKILAKPGVHVHTNKVQCAQMKVKF